jgi:hypothetical protein
MDVDDIINSIDSFANKTQADDVLVEAIQTQDFTHIKAAAVVAFFILCKDVCKLIIPFTINFLKSQFKTKEKPEPKQE